MVQAATRWYSGRFDERGRDRETVSITIYRSDFFVKGQLGGFVDFLRFEPQGLCGCRGLPASVQRVVQGRFDRSSRRVRFYDETHRDGFSFFRLTRATEFETVLSYLGANRRAARENVFDIARTRFHKTRSGSAHPPMASPH